MIALHAPRCASQRVATFLEIEDFLLAAWFRCITPAETALSSLRLAALASCCACSVSPESAASRKRRIEVLSADLTDLFRSRADSFCLLRLIWDLMLATKKCLLESNRVGAASRAEPPRTRRETVPARF